jgi:PBSX family phage terminase large subunit
MKSWHFTLEDNPYLSEQYVIDIKKEYTGLWYERYIDGKWVLADGTIYSNFNKSIHCIDKIPDGKWQSLYIGCDYGQTHPTAFLKAVKIGDTYYITDEYKESDKLNTTLSSDLKAFIGGKYPRSILVDPSAKSFKNQLIADDFKRVKNANNTVNDGLAKIANAFQTGKLIIVQNRCPQLIEEIGGYVWDSKASERGDEKPVKENDDLLDCLRYIGNEVF